MNNDLPVSLVFLDSSEYISCNFDYENPLFQALRSRIDIGEVYLGITKVTIGEIKNKIHEGVLEAKQALQSARKKARILRNYRKGEANFLFSELDIETIEKELIGQFEDFLKKFKTDILDYEDLNVERVFSLYFSHKAPFGLGKKKNEFPDAFSLEILEGWAESESSTVYVVSQDKDMKEGVKNYSKLEHVGSIADLISHLSFKYEKLAPLCIKGYEFARNAIDQIIKDDFSNRGFYVEDQPGDVHNIFDIEVEDYEPTLLSVEQKEKEASIIATFEVIATIEFRAEISYDDLATASYDSEDKNLIPHRIIEETVTSSAIVMSNATLVFQIDSPDDYKISSVSISALADDIAVQSSENLGWPYK